MQIFVWRLYSLVPEGVLTTAIAITAFLLGNYYRARIDSSVRSQYDKELEGLKSTLRLREDDQIRQRARGDVQLTSIVEQLLSLRSNKMSNLNDRRSEALLKLWGYTVDNAGMLTAAQFASRIKFENALDVAESGDSEGMKLRALGETFWKMAGLDGIKYDPSVDKVRPLVPQLVWAMFSAYRSALSHPVLLLMALKAGVGSKLMADPKPTIDLVKSILPHYEKVFDKFGANAFPEVLEELREKLLLEIVRSFDDPSSDDDDAKRSSQILAAVSRVEESRLAKEVPS